jgi:uncharacterized protein
LAAIGLLAGLAYFLLQNWLFKWAGLSIPGISAILISNNRALNYGLLLAAVWLLAAPYEEIVFRGFIFKRLQAMIKGASRFGVSLLIMSALYALYHVQQGLYGVINAFVFSLASGALLKVFKGDLWYPIFFHAAYFTFVLLI